jgi:hypothetical protein
MSPTNYQIVIAVENGLLGLGGKASVKLGLPQGVPMEEIIPIMDDQALYLQLARIGIINIGMPPAIATDAALKKYQIVITVEKNLLTNDRKATVKLGLPKGIPLDEIAEIMIEQALFLRLTQIGVIAMPSVPLAPPPGSRPSPSSTN